MAVVFGHIVLHGVANYQFYISLDRLERVGIVKACLASLDHFLETHRFSNDVFVVEQSFGDGRSEVAEIVKLHQDVDKLSDVGSL